MQVSFKGLRQGYVVVIEEPDTIPGCVLKTLVKGCGFPSIRSRQYLDPTLIALKQFPGFIGGAVVHHDDLVGWPGLAEQAV